MNLLSIMKLKMAIILRKQLLNILLLLFSPTNVLTVAISQDLDKYIVLYQKLLLEIFNDKHNTSNQVNEFVA